MLRSLFSNRVTIGALALATLFFGLVGFTHTESLIIFLNGIFAGSMVAILVAYHRLIVGAAMGIGEYNRVRQMTLGFAVMWTVICLSAVGSIYARSKGVELNAPMLTAAIRFLSIVGAVLQITAPDFGLGLFHGRDRKTLWTGFLLGMVVAVGTMMFQSRSLLF